MQTFFTLQKTSIFTTVWPLSMKLSFECTVCVFQEELLEGNEKTSENEDMLIGAEAQLKTLKNNMLQNDGMH